VITGNAKLFYACEIITDMICTGLSTIKDADCIIVFIKGKIAEMGTHAQLLAEKGAYYEMCLGQSMDKSVPT
jgi:ABC-type multidrug transport system fused ATPase/permease subunit